MANRKQEINRILVEIENHTSEVMQDAAFTLHGTLVSNPPKGTPVQTGYASAKWWFAVGALPGRTPDAKPPTPADIAAAGQQQQTSLNAAFNYDPTQGPLFVYNDTQYIEYLNNGSSKQSPAMFVEDAVDQMVRAINRKYDARVVKL